MKLALFFMLSVAFHAAILVFPVSFLGPESEQMIPIILLGTGGNGGQESAGKGGAIGERITRTPTPKSRPGVAHPEEQIVFGAAAPAETLKVTDEVPRTAEGLVTEGVVLTGLRSDGKAGGVLPGESAGGVGEENSGGRGRSGNGVGDGGSGGRGGPAGLSFAQASYIYNPKPKYPEAARKEGWEGTVLLRVLVDREGKSRSVEVSRSSGFETLDRAAMETVKVWRFHPAHYGERLVESWVKIPVVFSLADHDRGS